MSTPLRDRGRPPVPVSVDRSGYTIHGVKYPRVTTILNAMAKPALTGWAAKAVAEFAFKHRDVWAQLPEADAIKLLKGSPWSQRDAAADRGSVVHHVVEAYVRGEPLPDMSEDELACAIAAESFLKSREIDIRATEVTVYSPRHRYAGTLDVWCTIDGEPWLLDWKSGSGIYPEYALQLVAYASAERAFVGGEDSDWCGGLLWPPRLGVVHLRPDGYTLHEVAHERERLLAVWHALIALHRWMSDNNGALEAAL